MPRGNVAVEKVSQFKKLKLYRNDKSASELNFEALFGLGRKIAQFFQFFASCSMWFNSTCTPNFC